MASFIILVAVTAYALFNHQLAWGFPWRPRSFDAAAEMSLDRLQRQLALAVTILTIATA